MNSFIALWPPIRAIWRILAGQNRRGRIVNRWARLVILGVIFGVVAPIVLWPFVLLGVALTGSASLTAAIAFLPLVAFPIFVIILAVAYPLLSGILVTIPGIRILFGWLFVVIFGELLIGLYLAVIPVWNRPGLIPVLALLVVVLGMFLILRRQFVGLRGGWGGWFTTALALAIAIVTIAFFFGGKPKEKGAETRAAALPEFSMPPPLTIESVREIARIPLLGEGVPSEVALRPGMIPPMWFYYFDGPSTARVSFDGGDLIPIASSFGRKGGIRRFSGPAGSEVVVKAYPSP